MRKHCQGKAVYFVSLHYVNEIVAYSNFFISNTWSKTDSFETRKSCKDIQIQCSTHLTKFPNIVLYSWHFILMQLISLGENQDNVFKKKLCNIPKMLWVLDDLRHFEGQNSTSLQEAPCPTSHWTPKAALKFTIEGALTAWIYMYFVANFLSGQNVPWLLLPPASAVGVIESVPCMCVCVRACVCVCRPGSWLNRLTYGHKFWYGDEPSWCDLMHI